MMPLSMVKPGETNTIKKVGGKEETRKFLENLGFVTGGEVTVVSENRRKPDRECERFTCGHRKRYGKPHHGISRRIIKERGRML